MFLVPPPWHDPQMRKPAWLRRTLTLTTVLTSSSKAAGPASRWGRWGSRRGRRRCWRGGAAGRRSSWVWGKVQLEQLAPKRKVLPRLPTSGCTRDVYSTYSIYLLRANFIFATRCVHLRLFLHPLGMPSAKKSAVFFNIVQKAFDPPPPFVWTSCGEFFWRNLTKVRKRLSQQLSTK